MVIKDTLLHYGWSYGNGDDQYDNESVGSTKKVIEKEKFAGKSKENRQNKNEGKMCSSNNKEHTDDQGWTTISADSKRKPKTMTINQSYIDSIIATINVDINKFLKGAPEAKIDSPVRKNRCTIADTVLSNKNEEEFIPEKNDHQSIVPPGGEEEEEGKGSNGQVEAKVITREEGYEEKGGRFVRFRGDTRSNKAKEDERTETANWKEEIMEMTPTSKEEENMATGISTMAINGSSEVNQIGTSNGAETKSNNENQMDDNQDKNKNNDGEDKSSNNNKDGGGSNKQRVNILEPGDMDTYAFTVSWRPEQKAGKDGKIIIKNLMREMAHKTPSIIFHPTNSATSPVPRDINNINNDFPKSPASYDDFFDQTRNRDNTNQSTYMKVTMPHDEKELQRKLSNYLFYNKLYMNSPFINDNTLEHVGFIENGHSRMVYRPNLEMKIRKGLKEVMEGDQLTPQQTAQLKHLSSPIRVECQRGTIRGGPSHQQIVCEGIVLKTTKSQAKIAMELLSMLPEKLLGEHYRIIPKSLNNLLGYEIYGQIVADTVNFQEELRPITVLYCYPSVFEDMYDSVKVQNSKHVEVHKFIIENCGAVSIEETNETKSKGKYIVVVPQDKLDSARTAIGKMFQEFQQSGGRPTAMACLTAYQNFPLVNDNVTISGHAQRLSERIRDKYRNRPKKQNNRNSNASYSYSYHGGTAEIHQQDQVQTSTPTVPRSIIKTGRHNNSITTHQWPSSPLAQQQQQHQHQHQHQHQNQQQQQHQQQQQQALTPNNAEVGTIMSNLSPDDSAKTMMTNVSRMVETLGSAVNTLARESANTNDTMKNMMMQQTETMNNLMMIMARNEERRQEVPISIIQQSSTPSSTITNSQYSLSQQSSANKRKYGKNEEEATAASTVETGMDRDNMEEEEVEVEMEEDRSEEKEEIEEEQQQQDVIMEEEEQQQQEQRETTGNKKDSALAAGDFDTQFPKMNDKTSNAPGQGVNRQ
jgi:hypothetical protein